MVYIQYIPNTESKVKLSEIKTVSEFLEAIDWALDGNGLVITDAEQLCEAIAHNFDLEDDVFEGEDDA